MAIHNVIGDSFRGATWVSIHNGGGVGWGEVINGGFGLVLDGSKAAAQRLQSMLFFDVNNGIADGLGHVIAVPLRPYSVKWTAALNCASLSRN